MRYFTFKQTIPLSSIGATHVISLTLIIIRRKIGNISLLCILNEEISYEEKLLTCENSSYSE